MEAPVTKRSFATAVAALLIVVATACAPHRQPVVQDLAARSERVPVVLVPGITGTELVRLHDGRIVWGDGRSLMRPHDGGHAIALPLPDDAVATTGHGDVIHRMKLFGGLVRKPVYGPVVDLMEANGYQVGDLDDPRPEDTFFLFAYDWRRSGVDAAAALVERLEALRVARGQSRLTVDLIVQSDAARIGRYLIRYGGAPLEEAESGAARPPERVLVRKMILVGTANDGAIRVLREMNRGRRYVPCVGRKHQPEVLFTFRSLYEALPDGDDLFLDTSGRPMAVDLFDPANWSRYGWSIYDDRALVRALGEEHRDVFVDRETIDRHLARSLDRARRLPALLRTDPDPPPDTRYYLIQNDRRPTPARAVLACDGDGTCKTAFPGDRLVRRDDGLHERTTEPGDGHATLSSQQALPQAERNLIAAEPFHVDDKHFELILNPAAQLRMLEFLAE